VTAADHADDAGTAETAMHLDAPLRQPLRDQRAGALLLEANLRMRMEIPAPCGHFRVQLVETFALGSYVLTFGLVLPIG